VEEAEIRSHRRPKPAGKEKRTSATPSRGPELTNLDKVFLPEEGYTKGDLLAYYRTIAPRLLPI